MADNTSIEKKSKFSLIELLMIIMLVGIVFTLIIPLRNDRINQKKLKEAIYNIQVIARADIAFKEDPANGYYIFEHTIIKLDEENNYTGDDLLNIQHKLKKSDDLFYFDYSVSDSTVVATTNKNFGKNGAIVYYYLPNGPWGVGDDKLSKNIIDPNWLP
ncbi:MAG: type II secretion system GspH family protein [Candidatus Cloacimonetes bacterium]|nr:type II secretion system GspH family protein [Candidatus Cloacimonadota bacterium]